jgi:hypothetical protein
MRRGVFLFFAGLMALLCFFEAAPAIASGEEYFSSETRTEDDLPDAFSADAHDWHAVVVDLESSALVRVYGRIAEGAYPTDVTVGVSEQVSSVSAWIGDSGGGRIGAAQRSEGGDRYLVIEGKAADADVAGDATVRFVSYKIDGFPKIQFVGIPVRTRSAAAQTDDSGGCNASAGFVAAATVFALCRINKRICRQEPEGVVASVTTPGNPPPRTP